MNKQRPQYRLISYDIISAAAQGNHEAIATVLHHFEGYIAKLSLRRLYDDYGNACYCTDEVLKRRLEIKLITGILSFRAA